MVIQERQRSCQLGTVILPLELGILRVFPRDRKSGGSGIGLGSGGPCSFAIESLRYVVTKDQLLRISNSCNGTTLQEKKLSFSHCAFDVHWMIMLLLQIDRQLGNFRDAV